MKLSVQNIKNSNRLLNVSDAVSNQNTGGFVDGNTNPNVNDYEYDQNGNMILDRNKGITEISYNYLNLPEKIIFSNNDYIEYIYNAVGQKVSKYVSMENTNNTVKHVEYLDGFQYTGGQLNFFPHTEGYINVTLGTTGNRIFNYVYNYTDHLGNIRLSYTKDMLSNELKIMEENHYYPFGLKHQIYTPPVSLKLQAVDEDIARPGYATETEYQYKYNGKEWQDELGLGLYDYGARNYDPALGRWVNIDPLAEKFVPLSPYSYVANNPIIFIDKQGKIIGNPDGADAKRMQAILSKTETGRQVWNAMVKSDRTIYIHYVSANSDDPASRTAQSTLKNEGSDGRVVSKGMYESLINEGTSSVESFESAWSFNKNTGEYDKTSDWDETHILISEEGLLIESAIETSINEDNEQVGNDLAEMTIGGEEAVHSIQEFGDFTEKQKDPKTGKYIQNSNQKGYNERRHESEAKEQTKKMKDEYLSN